MCDLCGVSALGCRLNLKKKTLIGFEYWEFNNGKKSTHNSCANGVTLKTLFIVKSLISISSNRRQKKDDKRYATGRN